MAELHLILVTPRRQVLETRAAWADIPALGGWLRALPGHAPTLGALGAGLLRFAAATEQTCVLAGGFFEIRDDTVTLLADTAELPGEIDSAQARAAFDQLAAAPAASASESQAEAHRLELDLARARVDASR